MRGRAVAVAMAVAVAVAGLAGDAAAQVPHPDSDPFYAAPADLAQAKPGAILRSRQVTVTFRGTPLPYDSWQLLYRTNDAKLQPEAAVTTLIVPPGGARRPLVSYQTAEDSLATHCAPSYTLRTGTEREEAAIMQALNRGWAVVAPDYEGPKSHYGAGWQAGRAVLDSVRAAKAFQPAGLRGSSVGLWGYSGGALASAWAAEIQPAYAPELDIAGVAAGGVPPDFEAIARTIDGGYFAGILFAVSQGLERAYPEMDIQSILNAEGKRVWEAISDKCVEEITREGQFKRIDDLTTVPNAISLPRVQRVLLENHLGKATPAVPVYIYQAIMDQLIPIATVDALVDEYCREGATVKYHRDPASEHVALVATGAPAALAYLEERFGGQPAPTTCPADSPARAAPQLTLRRVRRSLEARLTKPASVRVSVLRLGRRRARRRATVIERESLQPGANVIRLPRRVLRRRGRYLAIAVAADLAQRRSAPATARFRILRPRPKRRAQ